MHQEGTAAPHRAASTRVLQPGRTFLRRMIELSKSVWELHYMIRLNESFWSDLRWWELFLPAWNGVGMMAGVVPERFVATITSDASGSWGCGAYLSSGEWFQLCWPDSWKAVNITVKELLPIVLGAALWGKQWRGRCRCDNAAIVDILKAGRSKDERVMHLMQSLFFFLASYNIVLVGEHIAGVNNGAADALSRDDVHSFRLQVPEAQPTPTGIPADLWDCLVVNRPDWTSPSWMKVLAGSLARE